MKVKRTLFFIVVLTFYSLSISVYALTPGDYHEKFWGGGLNVWVHYPEEAKRGDSITVNIYVVSGKFARGNHVEEVKAKISVLTTASSATLHDSTLISNTYMQNGEKYNQSISVNIPADARWFMTIQIDTISFQQDMTNRQEAHVTLDSTQIVSYTYSDLQAQIQELQAYNAQLGQQISELQNQLGAYENLNGDQELIDEYLQLQNTFNELFELHEANIEYIEDFEARMAGIMEAKDARIEELDIEVEELYEGNKRLEDELNTAVLELEEYLALTPTESGRDEEVTDYGSRNLFIGTTILASIIAITLYLKYNMIN